MALLLPAAPPLLLSRLTKACTDLRAIAAGVTGIFFLKRREFGEAGERRSIVVFGVPKRET